MNAGNPFRTADKLLAGSHGIASLQPGQSYAKVRCVVRDVRVDRAKTGAHVGKAYLSLTLGDRTGDLEVKSWEGSGLATQLHVGDVVELDRLEVDRFGGKFEPAALRKIEAGQYDPAEFVPSLPLEQVEQNWLLFGEFMDSLQNPHLRRLRELVWADPEVVQKYKTHPSAVHHHHNYLGGNVQHVVGIMRVVDAVCTSYPELDRDLVIFGAAVHDLGKLREYAVDTTIRVTDEGRLKGHLVIGAEWLGRLVGQLRQSGVEFSRGLEEDLVHLILSHHGRGDWGSPKPPATPEAMLLHLADMADSQTRGFLQEIERNRDNPEGWVRKFDADLGQNRWIRTRREYE